MKIIVSVRVFLLNLIISEYSILIARGTFNRVCIICRTERDWYYINTIGQSSFRFTAQPHNVLVAEGGEATFPCAYERSLMIPIWVINGIYFVWNSLPEQHNFNGQELIVHNVAFSLNGSTYQCLIPGVGSSSIGILLVLRHTSTFITPAPTSILLRESISIQVSSTLINPLVVSYLNLLPKTTTVVNSRNALKHGFLNQWFTGRASLASELMAIIKFYYLFPLVLISVLVGAVFLMGMLLLIAVSAILCYRYHKKKGKIVDIFYTNPLDLL